MITVNITNDMDLVRQVVVSPDIWDRLSDVDETEGFYPTTDIYNKWLLVMSDMDIIGVIYLHTDTNCSVGFHPYLFEKKRKYGREMIKVFFAWFLESIPEQYVKINVIIPECFKSTMNFAEKVGFTLEGCCKKSHFRDGVVYDRNFYGITREEIEE